RQRQIEPQHAPAETAAADHYMCRRSACAGPPALDVRADTRMAISCAGPPALDVRADTRMAISCAGPPALDVRADTRMAISCAGPPALDVRADMCGPTIIRASDRT